MDPDPLPSPLAAAFSLINMLAGSSAVEFTAPASWPGWAFTVFIAVLCLFASAFLSGSEIAFFGLTPPQIEELEAEDAPPARKKAQLLLENSERLLATLLIGNNLVNITMVVLLSFALNQLVVFHSSLVNFLVQTIFLTFLLLLFGEIFPKLAAKGNSLKWVDKAAPAIYFLYRIFGKPARIMVKSSGMVHRIVSKKHESLSADELSQALEISEVPAGKEKEMLEGILTFGEKEVSDIMISRVDVTDIEYHASWNEVIDTILRTGYSRIPVYDTTQDSIKGILYSKDLLPYIGRDNGSFSWQSLLRPAYFVPESRMIDDLLEDFRKKRIHIAVVVDEYGGTQGIVTLEDILEEIVGEIDDEYDEDSALYKKLSDDTYVFEAKISLVDFCRVTGVDEAEFGEAAEDVETLAGLLLALKGDFPTKKESIVAGRCRFLVLDIQKHRIIQVRVHLISPDEQSA